MTEPVFPPPPSSPASAATARRRLSPVLALMIVVVVLGAGLAVYGGGTVLFGYRRVAIKYSGMSQTLPQGTVAYRSAGGVELHRGDIVVFDFGSYPGGGPPGRVIERVIGLGGDTVTCCDQQNRIKVNGKPVTEEYLYLPPAEGKDQMAFTAQVPPGTVFVAGDYRNNSLDSRMASTVAGAGAVPVSEVYGVVVAVGNPVTARTLTPTTAFTDAGLPGTPLSDSGYANGRWLFLGGAVLFLAGFVGLLVTITRAARKRRRAPVMP
ncbi:signal peptidase I [Amycolatopsis sp. NPDC059027]|uniref:signal peptidase I n=1 Tax=unclassified Amycolatopsis TaxID=2618356 RepID=UPI00366C72AC